MDNNTKIVCNTAVVYTQLILSTIIGFFSVRFVLQALGEESYGIYMLVGGVVALLNFITGSLTSASTRFMAYGLGKNDRLVALKTFNTTLSIHLICCALVFVVLEVGGWAMFQWMLNIPDGRMFDAQVIYQCVIVTTLIAIYSVPYDSVLTAHENLTFLSITALLQNTITLIIGLFLLKYDGNRLISYGVLVMSNGLLIRIIKQIYCKLKYEECKVDLKKYKDTQLVKEIMSFTGWNLFFSISQICSTQLQRIFLNMFYGVTLNAGQGIATRVNGQVNQLSVGITQAITPQMTKSESGGNRNRLVNLTCVGVKYTSFMFVLVAIPLAIEADFILDVWLGNVPAYTAIFSQLIIISQLVSKLTWQIGNAITSVGEIKTYKIASSVLLLTSTALTFLVLKLGASPEMIYVVEIIKDIAFGVIHLYFGKKLLSIDPWYFIKTTSLPILIPLALTLCIALPLHFNMAIGWIRLIVVFLVFMAIYFVLFFFLSMHKDERKMMLGFASKFTNKFRK